MPDILVRNLDPETKRLIQSRARAHNRSQSDEAKALIRRGLLGRETHLDAIGLGMRLRQIALDHGFTELEIPPRDADTREPPDFT